MKIFRHSSAQRGFSLAEVLVAMTVFTVIIVAALMIYDRSNRAFKTGVEAAENQQNTRVAFDRLTADLRMTGFDFDRDGIPTVTSAFQAPDEQIEFLGRNALTIRGNFDYQTDPENGRECIPDTADPKKCQPNTGYESAQFPVVTVGNDEIVTYGLVSETGPNNDTISFYADVPDRKAFNDAGGRPENQVNITGVDFSNANPPYTLYRFTIAHDLNNPSGAISIVRTPLASNIRSMEFTYYEDPAGTVPLRDLDNVAVDQTTIHTTVGGLGQVNPAVSGVLVPRALREKVQSIRLTLIGMNEAPDLNYTDPTETVDSAKQFRKYRLETLISPRNYQRRGMREQEMTEPAEPTITGSCYGYCGAVYLEWESPGTGGGVESYNVLYDVDNVGGFANVREFGNQLNAIVPLPDPSQTYYFAVQAVNSFGASTSAAIGPLSVRNATLPAPPTVGTVTSDGSVPQSSSVTVLPALTNSIALTWLVPTNSASGSTTCTGGASTTSAQTLEELGGWEIHRSLDGSTYTLYQSVTLPVNPITRVVQWADLTVPNCVPVYYRVKLRERCPAAAEQVSGSVTDNLSGLSDVMIGVSTTTVAPQPPSTFEISQTSVCNGTSCDVSMQWSAVTQDTDTPARDIQVAHYFLERKKLRSGGTAVLEIFPIDVTSAPTLTADAVFTPTGVSFIDRNVPELDTDGTPFVYDYTVYAKQCGIPSAPGPTRRFPCTFAGGVLTVGMNPPPIEGDGLTAATSWLVNSPASIDVATSLDVQRIQAILTLLSDGSQTSIGDVTGPLTSTSFGYPAIPDGEVVRIDVTATDAGGCTRTVSRFVQDSPSSCCLVPQSFDASIVALDNPSGEVTIRLRNFCDTPLNIQSPAISLVWDDAPLTSNPRKLSRITYPPSSGGAPTVPQAHNENEGPVTSTLPSGALATIPVDIPGTGDDYLIKVKFSSGFTSNPITSLCVHYRRGATDLANQNCKILPTANTTANVCP